MREAITASDTKGADRATLSELRWWQYRMMHRAARSRTRRLIFALYRMLGYGERPGPPLLTWAASCALGALMWLSTADPSTPLIERFLVSLVDAVIWPAAALGVGGVARGLPASPPWLNGSVWSLLLVLLSALLVVTLGTALIAARKLIKRS